MVYLGCMGRQARCAPGPHAILSSFSKSGCLCEGHRHLEVCRVCSQMEEGKMEPGKGK